MNSSPAINIARFIILALLQVFILNNIDFGGYLDPYLYVLFILLLPVGIPGWLLLLSAFAMGFTIDIFMNTLGVNMAASLFMAWLRPGVIKLLSSGSNLEEGVTPNISNFGFNWFFIYALILVFFHHLLLFYLEYFKFRYLLDTLYNTAFSSIFTLVLIIITQYLFYKPKN